MNELKLMNNILAWMDRKTRKVTSGYYYKYCLRQIFSC